MYQEDVYWKKEICTKHYSVSFPAVLNLCIINAQIISYKGRARGRMNV